MGLKAILESVPDSVKHEYTRALEDLAKYGKGGVIRGSVTVAVKNGIAKVRLPILPENSTWVCGAVGAMRAKLATVGSAGNTVIDLVGPAGNVAAWSITGGVDTDDTYKNAGSVDQTGLQGGQDLVVNVTGLGTGAAGLLTLDLAFAPTIRMDDLFTATP